MVEHHLSDIQVLVKEVGKVKGQKTKVSNMNSM